MTCLADSLLIYAKYAVFVDVLPSSSSLHLAKTTRIWCLLCIVLDLLVILANALFLISHFNLAVKEDNLMADSNSVWTDLPSLWIICDSILVGFRLPRESLFYAFTNGIFPTTSRWKSRFDHYYSTSLHLSLFSWVWGFASLNTILLKNITQSATEMEYIGTTNNDGNQSAWVDPQSQFVDVTYVPSPTLTFALVEVYIVVVVWSAFFALVGIRVIACAPNTNDTNANDTSRRNRFRNQAHMYIKRAFGKMLIFGEYLPPMPRLQATSIGLTPEQLATTKTYVVNGNGSNGTQDESTSSNESEETVATMVDMADLDHAAAEGFNEIAMHRYVSSATCTICISDYVEGDVIRELPCGHAFHMKCVDDWLLDVAFTVTVRRPLIVPGMGDGVHGRAMQGIGGADVNLPTVERRVTRQRRGHNHCPICKKPVIERDEATDSDPS